MDDKTKLARIIIDEKNQIIQHITEDDYIQTKDTGKRFADIIHQSEILHQVYDLAYPELYFKKDFIIKKQLKINNYHTLHVKISTILINQQIFIAIDYYIHKQNYRKLFIENLLINLPGYVYWKDVNSVYLGCNKLFANAAGFDNIADVVGKTDYELAWSPEEAELARISDLEVMTGIEKINFEEKQKQADGSTKIALSSKAPVYAETSEIIGIMGIYFDITDKKLNEELRRKNEVNEKQIFLFKQVSATIAHELRTPLDSIRNFANAIANYLPDLLKTYEIAKDNRLTIPIIYSDVFKELKKLPKEIKSEVTTSNLFIDMMLANIRDEKFIGENQDCYDIVTIIKEAFDTYPFTDAQRELIEIDERNSFNIIANKDLIIHSIYNLIKNALYYIAAISKGKIYIWFSTDNHQNILHFKDTGTGIPAELMPHIFERFFTNRQHGTGVGLTFCKMVMQSLKGDITCQSIYNEYTQFDLFFPKINTPSLNT